MGRWVVITIIAGGALMAGLLSMSQTLVGIIAPPTPKGDLSGMEFTESYLKEPENIARGKQLWAKRCVVCHGKTSYSRSAPKLSAKPYQPIFIYDRITNGFNRMPAFKSILSLAERRSIVAYVKSLYFEE